MSRLILSRRSAIFAALTGPTLWPRAHRSTDTSSDIVDEMVCVPTSCHPNQSLGSIAEPDGGRLLMAYDDHYTVSPVDNSPTQINGRYSNDMGRTWTEPFTLVKNSAKRSVWHSSLLRLKSGELAITYNFNDSDEDCPVLFRTSHDEGRTFSDPVKVTARRSYWVINNERLVQLSSGRLLAPCQRLDDYPRDTHSLAVVLYSDDSGRTWRESDLVDIRANDDGADEPGVIELKDGRVMMYFRTALSSIYRCYSSDHGVTWTTPETMGLAAPVSPSLIKRIPSTSDLLIVWNHTLPHPKFGHSDRFPLTAAISPDEADTWENIQDVETDVRYSYAYPSITFVKDRVLITYYAAASGGYWLGLKLKSLPVQWFYGSKT